MNHLKRIAMVVALLVVTAAPFYSSSKASADLGPIGNLGADALKYKPSCGGTELDKWNWPKHIKDGPNTGSIPNGTKFDYAKGSYVIYKTVSDHALAPYSNSEGTERQNRYKLVFLPTENGKIRMTYDGTNAIMKYNGGITGLTAITSEPVSESKVWKKVWDGFGNGDGLFVSSGSIYTSGTYTLSLTDVQCVVVAHEVQYDDSWPFTAFIANQSYGDENKKCKVTDLMCILAKAANSIENAFQAVGMAIVQAIGYIFAPDGEQLANLWDEFYDWMQLKLGFLIYPFEFITGVFNAFTSGSSWCNSSSCTKNFGNFMGRNFTINLGQTQQTMPTLWTWFVAMIRGITIVTLLLAVRHKYRGITHK